ncbi:MAG: DUF5916 domain-containing protein, partial [Polaribacter sp.]
PNTGFTYLFLNSDNSKMFSFTLGYSNRHSQENVTTRDRFTIRTNYQPFDALSLSLNVEYANLFDATQYVTETNFNNLSRYILGRIQNQTLTTTLRLNYSFTPNLSLQFYGQPFISKGQFTDLNYVTNPVAKRLDNRVAIYDGNQIRMENDHYLIDENTDGITDYSFSNPDFSFVQLQTNLVARWEYIPGSELFLVWARGSSGNVNPSNDLIDSVSDQVFQEPSNDTFLIKATYRFAR